MSLLLKKTILILFQVHSKDGSEFYKLPSEEARDVKPPLPLPLHPLPIEEVLQQTAAANQQKKKKKIKIKL